MTSAQIFDAIHDGNVEFVARALAEHRAIFDGKGWVTWLESAASAGHLRIVEMLVEAGADVNEPASDHSGGSPEGVIDQASAEGHIDVVRWLMDHGAAVNHEVNGQTRCFALTGAAGSGHVEVVKLLIERGADINASWAGMTAIDHALTYGQREVADYLRSVGGKSAAELKG